MSPEEAIRKGDELILSGITSLTGPLNTPTSGGVDLSGPKRELARATKTRDETATVLDTERDRNVTATREQQAAIKRIGEADADKAAADAARAQEAANVHSYYAKLFGIDMDPAADIAVLASSLRTERAMAEESLNEIRGMQGVGMLDDPLEWFTNTLQLPSRIQAYNSQATKVNNMQRTIDSGIQTATNAAQEVVKTVPTITAAMAKATADKALADSMKQVAEAEKNLAKENTDFATKKLSNDLAIANSTRETSVLELNNEKLKYESKLNAVRIAESHSSRLLAAGKLVQELGQTAATDKLLENYDRVIGNAPGTTNRFVFNRLSDDQQKNMAAIGAGSGGTNPYEFLVNMIKARPGPNMAQGTKDFISFLSEEASKIKMDPTLPKELQPKRYAEELKKVIEAQKARASKDGLFHEISPDKMFLSGLIDPKSEFGKIIEPLSKQSGPMQPQILVATVMEGFKNPTIAGQAVAEYYAKNISLINESLPLKMAGVKPMDTYSVTLKGNLDYIGTARFDLTKPAEATKYILMLESRKRAATAGLVPARW